MVKVKMNFMLLIYIIMLSGTNHLTEQRGIGWGILEKRPQNWCPSEIKEQI